MYFCYDVGLSLFIAPQILALHWSDTDFFLRVAFVDDFAFLLLSTLAVFSVQL